MRAEEEPMPKEIHLAEASAMEVDNSMWGSNKLIPEGKFNTNEERDIEEELAKPKRRETIFDISSMIKQTQKTMFPNIIDQPCIELISTQ